MADSDNESGGNPNNNNNNNSDVSAKEQERFLPIANVSRIMKKGLPANAKISKEAKETVQECVSEFISFITGEASDKCQREKRKTLNGDDLLWAMTTLGFEDYVEPLKVYLHRYREMEGDKTISSSASVSVGRQPQKDKDAVAGSGEFNGMMMMGQYQGQVYSTSTGFHHMGFAEKPQQHYAAGSNGRTTSAYLDLEKPPKIGWRP